MHSQLVDGVLRDDRVGGEVGNHVGGTKAAGAGGKHLPFTGQRAQGHGSGSRSSGPHPGPTQRRLEALALGSAGSEARAKWPAGGQTGPARSHRALGLGCGVPEAGYSQAVHPNPRPGRSPAAGWAERAKRVGPAGAPPRSSWHPPDLYACLRPWGTGVTIKMPQLGRGGEGSRGVGRKSWHFLAMFQQKGPAS